eukprot:Em0011g85a
MGLIASRQFKRALQSSSEEAALQLYHNNEELRSMDPSRRYGLVNKTTPLHYAARKEFKQLFKEFMINGGNPNAENYLKQSVVHEICTSIHGTEPSVDSSRADMLLFLISFCTDPNTTCFGVNKTLRPQLLNLNKQDSSLNTPLHLAAASGLLLCARILIDHGAVVTCTNIANQTPLDCAADRHHDAIVALLEAKESYQGMRENDIQFARNELITETSSALGTSMTDSAALLQAYGWSKVLLVEAWLENTEAVCKKARILLPVRRQLSIASGGGSRQLSIEERECEVCSEPIVDVVPIPCGHNFCRSCWSEYLQVKIGDGKVTQLHCPAMSCEQIVPFDLISLVVGADMSAKYLKFGIDAFVEASEDIRWCPPPGVHAGRSAEARRVCTERGRSARRPKEGCQPTDSGLWVGSLLLLGVFPRTTRSLQLHEFCWVCFGSWRFHGSLTGGYFRCNKFLAAKSAEMKLERAKKAAKKKTTKEQEEYFKHIYSRFQNHSNSLRFEEQYLVTAKEKATALLVAACEGLASHGDMNDASFFEDAVRELIKCRQVLRACYALGYFLETYSTYKEMVKIIAPLEQTTEALAEVVARPHLKTPKDGVILATIESREARRKCLPEVRKLIPTKQLPPESNSSIPVTNDEEMYNYQHDDQVEQEDRGSFSSALNSDRSEEEDEAGSDVMTPAPPPTPPPPPPVQFNWRQQQPRAASDDVPPTTSPPSPPPPPPTQFGWKEDRIGAGSPATSILTQPQPGI